MTAPISNRVFLSASVPLPNRNPRYFMTADSIAIRDAIRALTIVVAQNALEMIFGGHPAITPMIRLQIRQSGQHASDRFVIYQTRFYNKEYPADNAAFERVVQTPASGNDLESSLRTMREAMLEGDFRCGIFIGGMEGVEQEYELFKHKHPRAPAYPIATTGAAAARLFDYDRDLRMRYPKLGHEYRYLSLMRDLVENGRSRDR